jgi:uncharacterized protein YbbC (DUF1343 family)
MTIGELALLFNTEYDINCKLDVIPMTGWSRNMLWEETDISWVPTSPHIPHWQTILYFGATGIFGELGVLSEGVGYTSPFEIVGAPWIDGEDFSNHLNSLNIPGKKNRVSMFSKVVGTDKIREALVEGIQVDEIVNRWTPELKTFKVIREKYLIYQ